MVAVRSVDPSVSHTPLALEATNLPTVCVLCSHNCGIRVDVADGRITAVRGDDSNPVTHGYLCNKIFSIGHYIEHAQRTTQPLRRRVDGSFEPVSWEVAIAEIAAKLLQIRDEHSPRAIGLVGIGGQANHMDAMYAAGFLRAVGVDLLRPGHRADALLDPEFLPDARLAGAYRQPRYGRGQHLHGNPGAAGHGSRARARARTRHRDPAGARSRVPLHPGGAQCTLSLSPQDAAKLGVGAGDALHIRTRRGTLTLPAQIDKKLLDGHVWMPNGFGNLYPTKDGLAAVGGNQNELTDVNDRDPFTGIPHHRYVQCQLERA